MSDAPVRVLIVDDQALIRSSLTSLLGTVEDVEVVGEAADGRDAVEQAARVRPDVVLMDIQMPVLDGIAATEQIIRDHEGTQVVMLTTFDLDAYVLGAVRAGAAGFLLKDGDVDDLAQGIRAAARGEALMAPSSLRRLMREFATRPEPAPDAVRRLERLTERERDVLRLMADGLSNTEIARSMVVEVSTVKSHVSRLLTKLDARDRTQAVVVAYAGGLVR
jgi:DNA-binding NarL/FixJ family response regulator